MNTSTGTPAIPKKWIGLGAIILLVVIIAVLCITTYNGCFNAEQNVDEKWGNVQTQYQRRKDLLPNFERTVKAYTEHESETYTNVTAMRSGNALPEDTEKDLQSKLKDAQKAQEAANSLNAEGTAAPATEQDLDYYLQAQAQAQKTFDIYVNAVREAYPDLKSSQNFRDFQTVLEGTENRIQTARQDYNAAVKEFNQKRGRFPNVIFSGMLGFQKKPMFRADADAQTAPAVFEP